MHDLSLSPPVDIGVSEDAKHSGPCFDGVYGCDRCWNAANDGKGEIHDCDACDAKEVHTKIVRAVDEPVLYAACDNCQRRRMQALLELERELDSYYDEHGFRDDDEAEVW